MREKEREREREKKLGRNKFWLKFLFIFRLKKFSFCVSESIKREKKSCIIVSNFDNKPKFDIKKFRSKCRL